MPYSKFSNEPNREYWFQIWRSIDPIELAKRLSVYRGPLDKIIRNYFSKNEPILDGGCGLGQWSIYLAARGYDVTSLDFDEQTIKRLKKIKPEINWRVGYVQNLPFEDNQFGGYLLLGVIEHLQYDIMRAIDEAFRVLKDSGTLIVSVPFYSPFRKFARLYHKVDESKPFYQYYFEQNELIDLLSKSGFEVIDSLKIDPVLGLFGELPYIGQLYVSAQRTLVPARRKKEIHNPIIAHSPTSLYSILKTIHDPINESPFMCKIFAHMIVMVCKK